MKKSKGSMQEGKGQDHSDKREALEEEQKTTKRIFFKRISKKNEGRKWPSFFFWGEESHEMSMGLATIKIIQMIFSYFQYRERMNIMKVVKGNFREEKEKGLGKEMVPEEASGNKVVDFQKAREKLENETEADNRALDDFLATLTPEQLAALDRVTESIADEAFDALDDTDELMDELDEEIDRLFEGLHD